MIMKVRKKESAYKALGIMAALLILITSTYLYYRQCVVWAYHRSDLIVHVLLTLPYSLCDVIIQFLYKFVASYVPIALFLGVVTCLSGYSAWILLRYLLFDLEAVDKNKSNSYMCVIIGFMVQFVSSIYIPLLSPVFYSVNSFATQPWHNPTYTCMRLFMFLVFMYFLKVNKVYKNKLPIKELVAYTVFSFLCNWMKPSYAIALCPVILLIMIVDFVKIFLIIKKGNAKIFGRMIVFGCCTLIGLSIMLFQYGMVYTGEDVESEVIFTTKNFMALIGNPQWYVMMLAGLLFPLYVGILALIKKYKNGYLGISYLVYLMSLLQKIFIAETGPRESHGNFSWGERGCAVILFVCSVTTLWAMYKKDIISKKQFIIGMFFFWIHCLAGGLYYLLIFKRDYFMI